MTRHLSTIITVAATGVMVEQKGLDLAYWIGLFVAVASTVLTFISNNKKQKGE